ncbi:hypothetical protein [Leucobacter musarum]|uniref:hypothetical protein n=1 Tax=Leucobacter musarum TaxID=1930747 RepID=UPI0006A79068|nr:hypothetical protein [Leucobacter musarum]
MDTYVPVSTFWFSLALVNAGLAEQKNRSRWNWFLLSLILGPIATALIVVWERPETRSESFIDAFARYRAAKRAERASRQSQSQATSTSAPTETAPPLS